jgi:hypothetical protein
MKANKKNWKPRVKIEFSTGTRWHKSVKDYSRKQKHKNSRFED